MNDERSPLSIVFDRNDEASRVTATDNARIIERNSADSRLLKGKDAEHIINIDRMLIRVGNFPLQGTSEAVIIAISRSLRLSIILVPVTPQALQPRLIQRLSACFPQAPHFLKHLSRLKAIRGR